jgi:23S rRNA (guanine2445-N2)-methyltransferase / 23S rRNA (guanine2069-N7)-methyltransferase
LKADQSWFVTCPKGIEGLLLNELIDLGGVETRETVGGCYFIGGLAVAYRVALWSRLANRVLMPLDRFPCRDGESLRAGIEAIDWSEIMEAEGSLLVNFSGQTPEIRNTQYGAQVCKDGIVDYFKRIGAGRPRVERDNPDLRLNVRLRKGDAVVAIDFVGASLHQRGYRTQQGEAPIKENLAAACLLRADWPGVAARGGALIDPMCGSGTLLLEAAMMVADIAPGLRRERWGFEKLKFHNAEQWRVIQAEAQSKAARAESLQLPEIRGYDANIKVIDKAQANIDSAGLNGVVRVSCKPLAELVKPTHRQLDFGLLISNPPYGERLGDVESLRHLYRKLGEVMLAEFTGWQAAILTAEKELGLAIGLRSHKRYALFNGPLPVTLLLFELDEQQKLRDRPQNAEAAEGEAFALSNGAEMLLNRLRKNRKKWDSWGRKRDLECYRVYDADMPEYSVAIDRYGEQLHVAEYQAPKTVPEEDAERRMQEVRQVVPIAFDCAPEQVHYKQRRRQRGLNQYEKQDRQGELLSVVEGRVKLLVNLSDYLDTGLFLDHRPLRMRLANEAKGKHFLNLYCYTASASVHAAKAGARSTTSVDMSKTYLDWARSNFEANGLGASDNKLERADCLSWLQECERRFDLIFLDPPSFSNSKRMEGNLDVQRDQMSLLEASMACLAEGGTLYFSNNLRSFKLDPQVAERWHVEDISRATIDDDFARRSNIHHCWKLQNP